MTIAELLNAKEGENAEFKEAKNSFEFDTLVKYACAVSNLGGGRVVFGIMDKRPRKVVSSLTFERGSSRPNISNQNTQSRTMLVEKWSVELKNTNV